MRVVVLVLMVFVFFACEYCSGEKRDFDRRTDLIDLNEEKIQNKTLFSSLIDTREFVALETNSKCHLSAIAQVRLLPQHILVLDNMSKQVLLFDRAGSFVSSLGIQGEGPGEFIYPKYIDYDLKEETVFILDANQRKVIAYDLQGDFKFEFRIGIKDGIQSFCSVGDGKFLFELQPGEDQNGPMLGLTDRRGKILETYLDDLSLYTNVSFRNGSLYRTDYDIKFFPSYENYIFSYKDGEIEPIIRINSLAGIDRDLISKIQMEFRPDQGSGSSMPGYKMMWGIQSFIETSNFICFYYMTNVSQMVGVMIDKHTNEASQSILVDDLNPEYIWSSILYGDRDYLVKHYVPGFNRHVADFKQYVLSNDYYVISPESLNRIENLTLNSNPVLILHSYMD